MHDAERGGQAKRAMGETRHGSNLQDFVLLAPWPTPNAGPQNDQDSTWEARREALKAEHKNGNGFGLTLGMAATLAPWPTPCQQDGPKGGPGQGADRLPAAAALAPWPTPMAGSPATETYNAAGNTDSSRRTVALIAGWPTPNAMEGGQTSRSGKRKGEPLMGGLVHGTWATPTTRDHKDGDSGSCQNVPINSLLGRQIHLSGSPAETAKPGQLNPAFSLWLMGYGTVWASCGEAVTRSSRKRLPPSSKRT